MDLWIPSIDSVVYLLNLCRWLFTSRITHHLSRSHQTVENLPTLAPPQQVSVAPHHLGHKAHIYQHFGRFVRRKKQNRYRSCQVA